MAKKVQVILVDDMDGGTAVETVSFALDGSSYELDLSVANAAALRDALAPYVGAGRKLGRSSARAAAPRGRSSARVDREQSQAIRDWATRNGHQVSSRGRIPANVVDAFNAAH
ncbi:Lsr2 family protein [soil metagenome]